MMAVDQFCLKWNNFQSSIINAFESLQTTQDLADVTLTCEGMNVKAHKIILSACSPYFRTVFKENPCPHPIVILKDVLYVDLLAVLNFMYHGEVLVAKENLKSFLQTAEILQVSGLNGYSDFNVPRNASKVQKMKTIEATEPVTKRLKSVPKPKPYKNVENPSISTDSSSKESLKDTLEEFEVANVKMEIPEDEYSSDFNKNRPQQSSILETVLDGKDQGSSILERSLMSNTASIAKSPNTNLQCALEHVAIVSEIPQALFVPRKTIDDPDIAKQKHILKKTIENSDTQKSPKKQMNDDQDLQKQKHITTKKTTEDLEPQKQLHVHPSMATLDLTMPEILHPVVKIETGGELPKMDAIPLIHAESCNNPHHSSQCGNCPHCGKVYSNQSALKYHVRLVHSDLTNMYCCHLCPESFDYREGYKKHMVEVHKVRN